MLSNYIRWLYCTYVFSSVCPEWREEQTATGTSGWSQAEAPADPTEGRDTAWDWGPACPKGRCSQQGTLSQGPSHTVPDWPDHLPFRFSADSYIYRLSSFYSRFNTVYMLSQPLSFDQIIRQSCLFWTKILKLLFGSAFSQKQVYGSIWKYSYVSSILGRGAPWKLRGATTANGSSTGGEEPRAAEGKIIYFSLLGYISYFKQQ